MNDHLSERLEYINHQLSMGLAGLTNIERVLDGKTYGKVPAEKTIEILVDPRLGIQGSIDRVKKAALVMQGAAIPRGKRNAVDFDAPVQEIE